MSSTALTTTSNCSLECQMRKNKYFAQSSEFLIEYNKNSRSIYLKYPVYMRALTRYLRYLSDTRGANIDFSRLTPHDVEGHVIRAGDEADEYARDSCKPGPNRSPQDWAYASGDSAAAWGRGNHETSDDESDSTRGRQRTRRGRY